MLLAVLVLALLAPVLPLAHPDLTNPADRLKPPFSDGAILGTDHLGRDLLSRLVWGTRLSLAVGVAAALLAAVVGSAITANRQLTYPPQRSAHHDYQRTHCYR